MPTPSRSSSTEPSPLRRLRLSTSGPLPPSFFGYVCESVERTEAEVCSCAHRRDHLQRSQGRSGWVWGFGCRDAVITTHFLMQLPLRYRTWFHTLLTATCMPSYMLFLLVLFILAAVAILVSVIMTIIFHYPGCYVILLFIPLPRL